MASDSRFDKAERMIYLHFRDNLTADEFHAALVGEREFFEGMTGRVGLLAEFTNLTSIPPAILTHARNTYFARYKNIVIALVGASAFVNALAQMFSKLTGISVKSFTNIADAEAYLREQIADHSTH